MVERKIKITLEETLQTAPVRAIPATFRVEGGEAAADPHGDVKNLI